MTRYKQIGQSLKQRGAYWITRAGEIMDRYPIHILGIIVLFGLLLSTTIILADPPSMESGSTDSWWVIGLNLIHGQGYSLCIPRYFPFCEIGNQTTAAREPVPVLLFALVAKLSNESLWAATAFELLIYLSVLICVYLLTLEWATRRAALIAAFLWTIYLPAVELIPQVSGDLLGAFFVTFGMLFVLRSRKTNRVKDWVIAGAGLGLGILSRSAILTIPAILMGGLIVERWRQGRNLLDIIKPSLILFGAAFLIMLPWIVRNQISLGRPLLGSSLVGYNIFRQSYALTTDNYLHFIDGVDGKIAVQELLVERKKDLSGMENEAQMDVIYKAEAIKIIRSHPFKYMLSSGYRFFLLWFNWQIPEGYLYLATRRDYTIMGMQVVLMIFAWIGARKGNFFRTWPLWGSLVIISLAYMAVESQLRFLIPVMPLLISLSAVGINRLFMSQPPDTFKRMVVE